jgi:hypothetical protein
MLRHPWLIQNQPMGLSSWDKEVAACKKSIMERALRKTGGNRAEAGRMLGLHPTYFSKICKELDEPGRME